MCIVIIIEISSDSIIDDSDKDKDYVPPSENKRNLEDFGIIGIDVDPTDEQTNNDSIVNVIHSDNDKDIVSLIDYLCVTGKNYNLGFYCYH